MKISYVMSMVSVCVFSAAFTGPGLAALVNVDYAGGRGDFSGAAAIGAAGDLWTHRNTGISGTGPINDLDLIDSNGVPTNIDASVTSVHNMSAWNNDAANNALTGDGIRVNVGSAITLTLSDLNPLLTYNLILYGAWQQTGFTGRGAAFNIGGDIKTTTGTNLLTTFPTEGISHVTYAGLTPNGANQIIATITTNNDPDPYFNGFQLQAVPTPSSILLMGTGLIGLIGRRWWDTRKLI